MNKKTAEEIRKLVDKEGWRAVRNHPRLGKIWAVEMQKQRAFEARIG